MRKGLKAIEALKMRTLAGEFVEKCNRFYFINYGPVSKKFFFSNIIYILPF